jgi:uncharacterized protein with NAD-binding domain and iron-sulfur cluster
MSGRIAIVGGGWAGMAAAVTLAAAGRPVTVFEAATTLGGRARRVDVHGHAVDNGQHILLGAYGQTLSLLRTVQRSRRARIARPAAPAPGTARSFPVQGAALARSLAPRGRPADYARAVAARAPHHRRVRAPVAARRLSLCRAVDRRRAARRSARCRGEAPLGAAMHRSTEHAEPRRRRRYS